jgi:hypothetical protein
MCVDVCVGVLALTATAASCPESEANFILLPQINISSTETDTALLDLSRLLQA